MLQGGLGVAGFDSGARFAGFGWSPKKNLPEILGAGPGILILGPRFVGSAGDALRRALEIGGP
jgi:hypothetical protein